MDLIVDAGWAALGQRAVEVASAAGASYADARIVELDHEGLAVRNGDVEGVRRSSSLGIGVRVVADGCWGFAAIGRLDPTAVEVVARRAVEVARAGTLVEAAPVRLVDEAPVVADWSSPVEEDPFAVALEDKLGVLVEATLAMRAVDGVSVGTANFDAWGRTSLFVSSEGARIGQRIVHCGSGMEAVAVGETEVQNRSFPNSFGGECASGGYEVARRLDLPGRAPEVAEQAVRLLGAEECPEGETTLVLDGSQLALQVHESIGHPIELDRVLGMEAAYAGTSFLAPGDLGTLRYGSRHLNVVADATTPGALGTFGYDDEGVPATATPIVTEGIFTGFLSSRETAAELGLARSGGTVRAESWAALPLIRMTNVSLQPGEADSLDELLDGVDHGIYLETNRSWSIDDRRVDFQFGTEWGREIRNGKLGRVVRNGSYAGRTQPFWGSLDAVGGPQLWKPWGLPNCGKGQPGQVGFVAHGAAPARFRNVRVGVR
ncbi:MAG: TldD/PmbA family protein [Actinomycetota bacterium]|nr:TldD/PmbA family protein [Actinomycetota bacterium]